MKIVTSDIPSCPNRMVDTWNKSFRAKINLRMYLIKTPYFIEEEIEAQRNNIGTAEFKLLSFQ